MARLKAQRKDKILSGRTLQGGGGLILQSASIYTIQKVYIQKFGCNFRHQSSLRIATHVLNLGGSKQQNMGGLRLKSFIYLISPRTSQTSTGKKVDWPVYRRLDPSAQKPPAIGSQICLSSDCHCNSHIWSNL